MRLRARLYRVYAVVFSTVASFGMVNFDCDAPAAADEELGTFFSFQTAILTRSRSPPTPYGLLPLPLQTLASGLTLATARPPGLCKSLCYLHPVFTVSLDSRFC